MSKGLLFAPRLPFKRFSGDVSAQIILISQPAQVAVLADLSRRVVSVLFCSELWIPRICGDGYNNLQLSVSPTRNFIFAKEIVVNYVFNYSLCVLPFYLFFQPY
jgi:hypothetical protein